MKTTELYKVLSAVVLVNAELFRKTSAAQIPATLAEMQTHNKPLQFEDKVISLTHVPTIIDKMVKGEDVSLSLELLDVNLSDDEQKSLGLFRGVVDKLKSFAPPYPFAEVPPTFNIDEKIKKNPNGTKLQRAGHSIGVATAKRIWNTARVHWVSGKQTSKAMGRVSADGYGRYPQIYPTYVAIGCQTIQRYELEQLALREGWDFA